MNDVQHSLLICDGCLTDQTGNQYSLWHGLNQSHEKALLDFSKNDPLIGENTGDTTRFATPAKLHEWLSGERIMCVLTPQAKPDEMVGLIWFSREPWPLAVGDQATKHSLWTFAIRLYGAARGQRLSSPFMQKAFAYFQQKHPDEVVWLSTKSTNQISQKIYTRFGFTKVAEQDERSFYVYNNRV